MGHNLRLKFISRLQLLLAFRPSRKLKSREICAKKMVYDTARLTWYQVPDGLGVRIPGFHPGGPGSIPGLGVFFGILFFLHNFMRNFFRRILIEVVRKMIFIISKFQKRISISGSIYG